MEEGKPMTKKLTRKQKEEMLLLMEEKKRRQQEIKALHDTSNERFIPLYDNNNRYLVLVGGGGSGKSIFAGRKLLHRVTKEQGHRFLVVRKVAKTLRESCFQQLRGQIGSHYNPDDFDINKTDMRITYKPNGNEIIFAGLDDVEKLKSIYNITSIWIEEANELEEQDLNQLDIRLRGETKHYKQILITFNPVDVNHWLKKRFFDRDHPDTLTMHSTYKDNRFLDDAAKMVLESFRESDPYYYQVYCLGEWGTLGKTIFNAERVNARIAYIRNHKPVKQGYFEYTYKHEKILDDTITWVDAEDGYIRIYEDVIPGYPYVAGGDTSGEGSDFFVGQVLNNVTGVQAATLRHAFDEGLYARQMYCLGRYYNEALLNIETNFSTYPVKELERLEYPNLFMRQVEDSITHKIQPKYGFQTTKVTRPLIIAELVEIVREHTELINDLDTLNEMLTFVRNEKGKPEAQTGAHDDCIMSLAIAFYTRPQQSMLVQEKPPEKLKGWWTRDELEDKGYSKWEIDEIMADMRVYTR